MKIVVDSREKWTQSNSTDTHIKSYFDRHGIEYEVRKLDVGDYQLADNPNLSIDRKQSLLELSRNLLNLGDSARFWREVRRAHERHIKLIILIEDGRTVKTIQDIKNWNSKYNPFVSGRKLMSEMIRCEMAYGVTFALCDKRSTAKRIVEILSTGVNT